MFQRTLAVPLHRAALRDQPVLVQGPRGAGKTALLRREFPAHTYVTLADPGDRARARRDAGGFLARLRGPAVVDDLHLAPELWAAAAAAERRLLLASSRRLRLSCETFELHPPTQAERAGRPALALEMLGHFAPAPASAPAGASEPAAAARAWLERDVRALVNVHDLDRFEAFYDCALARSGAVLDRQALAAACSLSHRTVVRWLEVLDACFLTLRLAASEADFGRRLVRSPKLHFFESRAHESRTVTELYCNARHAGLAPELRFWRDSNGLEIALVVQWEDAPPMPVCVAAEPNPADIARLRRWMELAGVERGAVIAGRPGGLPQRGLVRYSYAQL